MNESERPSPGQMANVGFMIAIGITKTLEKSNVTFDQLKNFKQEEAEEIASRILLDWLKLVEEKWFKEKKKISLFWKKFFKIEIDWSKYEIKTFDPKFNRMEYVAKSVTCQQLLDGYAKAFGEDSIWKYWSRELDKYIKDEQTRFAEDYVFVYKGSCQPDKEYLGKSYDDIVNMGLNFMILKEGLIMAFRFSFETNKNIDDGGCVIKFATLDTKDSVMSIIFLANAKLQIGAFHRGSCDFHQGFIEISF